MEDLTVTLNKLISNETTDGALPGIVCAVADQDGTIFTGSAGHRNLDTGDLMAVDTIINIASMTKPVTCVAVLQLYDRGLIELDSPISEYLPQATQLLVLSGYDSAGEPILNKPEKLPTVRQLLSHTSGFVYEVWNEQAMQGVSSGKRSSMFDSESDWRNVPLAFEPGSRWEYGIGID